MTIVKSDHSVGLHQTAKNAIHYTSKQILHCFIRSIYFFCENVCTKELNSHGCLMFVAILALLSSPQILAAGNSPSLRETNEFVQKMFYRQGSITVTIKHSYVGNGDIEASYEYSFSVNNDNPCAAKLCRTATFSIGESKGGCWSFMWQDVNKVDTKPISVAQGYAYQWISIYGRFNYSGRSKYKNNINYDYSTPGKIDIVKGLASSRIEKAIDHARDLCRRGERDPF